MGFGKNYLRHRGKMGVASAIFGKNSGVVRALDTSYRIGMVKDAFTGGNRGHLPKAAETTRSSPQKAASDAVKRSSPIAVDGKNFNAITAKVREETAERVGVIKEKTAEGMKKDAAQKAVRYSAQSAALEEMIKGEMAFEARGVNSMGFPVSKKGLNDVKGLINDFDGGVYPRVVVMTDLVIENKNGLIEKQPFKRIFLEKLHRNKYTGPVLSKINSLL